MEAYLITLCLQTCITKDTLLEHVVIVNIIHKSLSTVNNLHIRKLIVTQKLLQLLFIRFSNIFPFQQSNTLTLNTLNLSKKEAQGT